MSHTWMKRTLLLPTLLLTVPALVGCASSHRATASTAPPARGETAAAPREGETCFNASMATSFDYIRPRYMYVTVVGDKHYVLTLAQECIGLESAMNINIRSRFEQVCSQSMDSVIFVNAFGHPGYCRIVNIQEVKDRAAADALVNKELETGKPGY